ncbi:MAG: hypothetical protein DHS20C03_34130 [Minwuia thermotolerans]|nr:MAG: hypothetical protein DHS20C03_34130 [Minwuia thermotolerans]
MDLFDLIVGDSAHRRIDHAWLAERLLLQHRFIVTATTTAPAASPATATPFRRSGPCHGWTPPVGRRFA